MPVQDRVRLEEEHVPVEVVLRAGGQSGERGGEDGQGELLAARQPGRAGALAQAHLLPKHEELAVLLTIATTRADDEVDEECDAMAEHEPEHLSRPTAQHPSTSRCTSGALIAGRGVG